MPLPNAAAVLLSGCPLFPWPGKSFPTATFSTAKNGECATLAHRFASPTCQPCTENHSIPLRYHVSDSVCQLFVVRSTRNEYVLNCPFVTDCWALVFSPPP